MIKEMKTEGNKFAVQNAKVCSEYCNYSANSLTKMLSKIRQKWKDIEDVNDKRLDEVDNNHDTQVNYTVCAPYSFELISY